MPATLVPPVPRSRPVPASLRLAGLTVVLPCLNEEPNIGRAIAEALTAAERCASAVEVVVVDDGSTDGTFGVAGAVAAGDGRVRIVRHEANRGYGGAVRSGIDASRMPWVLLTDADLQFDLGQLEGMLALAAEHDLVAGFRVGRSDPWHRRAAAGAWNRLMRGTFGIETCDVDCAFKLARGPLLRALPLGSEGAMISTEIYARAGRAGWRIAQVGVRHRPRPAGASTGGNPRVVLRAFAERRALRRTLAGDTAPGRGDVAGAAAAVRATAP